MADFLRIGEVAKAVGVSVDTLRRWEAAGRVPFVRRGNQRLLAADDLPPLLASHRRTHAISARNHFAGVVVSVARDGVMAKVELACGPFRLVSLMSREAADELGLEPGVDASAVVKSTSVMVER